MATIDPDIDKEQKILDGLRKGKFVKSGLDLAR